MLELGSDFVTGAAIIVGGATGLSSAFGALCHATDGYRRGIAKRALVGAFMGAASCLALSTATFGGVVAGKLIAQAALGIG